MWVGTQAGKSGSTLMTEVAVAVLKDNEDMMIMIAVFCPCCNEKYPDE